MLTRLRLRFLSVCSRNFSVAWVCAVAYLLIGIGFAVPRTPWADDIPPSPRPERVAEEVDIFRERTKELARQERKEAAKKQKTAAKTDYGKYFTLTPLAPTDTSDGPGLINRIGHLAGSTFGRTSSITPLEIMPYMLTDEHFLFSDVRGFLSNRSQAGGSAGVGYRYLREDNNAWTGASLWYDADQSTTKLFQQIGLSFEGLVDRFELRSNVYLPFTSSQTLTNTIGSASIVGNQLLYGRNVTIGTALSGVDGEVGYVFPVRERHVVRAFVGAYHFEGGSTGSVNGLKARVEGVLNNGVTGQIMYTNDKLYGSNLMVGVTLQFPFGNNHPTGGWTRGTPSPFRFVERNYNVIVSEGRDNSANQVAADPTTGKAYNIEQVYVPQAGQPLPAGTLANGSTVPYRTIAAAQAAGGNVIIVQSGSVITESVKLTDGQYLFGQGNYPQLLHVTGGGTVQIPNLVLAANQSSSTQTPVFANTKDAAITLASNNEVAGFNFSNTGGGIAGANASNIDLHDLKFLTTGGDAIYLNNSSGNVNLSHIQINGAVGNGIVIDGGTANINYQGAGTTITAQQSGFVLENITGGVVGLSSLTVKNTGASGLQMNNVATGVAVDSFTANQTTGPAISISGVTGTTQIVNGVSTNFFNTYNFTGNTNITSPKATGFYVNGTDAIVNVKNLNVTSTSGSAAVFLSNATSQITFSGLTLNTAGGGGIYGRTLTNLQINAGSITSVGAPAIDIQSSTINTALSYVSANGGPFGISLANTSGIFTINGSGNFATGGTIQNTTTGVLLSSMTGTTTINWMDLTGNGTGIKSTATGQLNLDGLRITNTAGYAVDSLDDSSIALGGSILSGNGIPGGGTIRIQADTVGTFQSTLSQNAISDQNGTAIQYLTAPSGTGASLAGIVNSNTIYSYHGSSPVIGVNWNGPAQMVVSNNIIYASGSNTTGILINDPSVTASLNAQVDYNTITFGTTTAQSTGISIIDGLSGQSSVGTSLVNVYQNQIDFQATTGIGTRFAFYGTSTDYITANTVTDQAGGATGMLFDYVAANSHVNINGNTINLLSTDLTTHNGIIFTSVAPTIVLGGSVNNSIYNVSGLNLFSIPVNAATGGFYINGTLVE